MRPFLCAAQTAPNRDRCHNNDGAENRKHAGHLAEKNPNPYRAQDNLQRSDERAGQRGAMLHRNAVKRIRQAKLQHAHSDDRKDGGDGNFRRISNRKRDANGRGYGKPQENAGKPAFLIGFAGEQIHAAHRTPSMSARMLPSMPPGVSWSKKNSAMPQTVMITVT